MNKTANTGNKTLAKPRVLICDDDLELSQLLAEYLLQNHIDVVCVETAEQAMPLLESVTNPIDALVLDLMLPGIDGLTALKRIRQHNALPILMMSARGEPIDRVIGLELGADDYLSKPCFPRELLARLNVLLRRVQDVPATQPASDELALGALRLRLSQRRAWFDDEVLQLTGAEFTVLSVLAADAGTFVSREKLTSLALHRPLERFDRAIDVHVSRLRKKLQQVAADNVSIDSARGAGYVLVTSAPRQDHKT